jgi:hypothetical protein
MPKQQRSKKFPAVVVMILDLDNLKHGETWLLDRSNGCE